MGFLDSYKRVEKICNEMYGGNHGLSYYIEDMVKTPLGYRYVSGWEEDLKQLKHYRWIRNRIVHDPGCTAENMCDMNDIQWLDDFYSRIITGKDPIAIYHKKTNTAKLQNKEKTYQSTTKVQTANYTNKRAGCLTLIIFVVIIVAAMFLTIMSF